MQRSLGLEARGFKEKMKRSRETIEGIKTKNSRLQEVNDRLAESFEKQLMTIANLVRDQTKLLALLKDINMFWDETLGADVGLNSRDIAYIQRVASNDIRRMIDGVAKNVDALRKSASNEFLDADMIGSYEGIVDNMRKVFASANKYLSSRP